MDLGTLTGVLVLSTTVPVALVVLLFAYKSRSFPGVRPFAAIVLLSTWWSIAFSLESFAADLSTKLVWSNLQFISITLLPVAFLTMALQYTGRESWTTRSRVAILCLVPLVTNVFLWASEGLMRASVWLDTSVAVPVIGRTWGPWFWVHATYSYLLLLLTLTVLVAAMRAKPRLRHRRLTAVFIGTVIPMAASVLETVVPSSSPLDDLTPAVFVVSLLILSWGLLRVRIFNLVPVARRALVENMRDGLMVLDTEDYVVDINESARALIGLPKSRILGQPLASCWDAWQKIASPDRAKDLQTQLHLQVEGQERHFEARASSLAQHGYPVARTLVLTDVTDRVLLERSLRDQALADGLTGLPNRALLMSRLDETLRRSRRNGSACFAVMVLDLDYFKLVNDSLGHVAGDLLLQNVAAKLSRCVRDTDTVARIGGDEFIILIHDICTQRDLLPVLTRIRSELRAPVYFGRKEMVASSSIGVVICDAHFEDSERIVRAADAAMYQAKREGRDRYRFYDAEMHEAARRAEREEAELRDAIRDHAFSVVYQPIVDLPKGELQSLEALLRWQHPERGTIFPRDFLPAAENSALILPLGEIALDEIFSHVSHWSSRDPGMDRLPIRVNVSPRQLVEPDFVSSVLSRLAAWKVPSERLTLEMTEHALINDPAKAKQAAKRLHGLGVRLCLEDYGTGRSSLQHLTDFPLHDLKIDPSYVAGMAPDTTELELVRHITALAHTLGLTVMAEGVESEEQWRSLLEAGCDLAQGHYVASPMEFDMVLEFIKDLPGTRVRRGVKTAI